MPGSMNRGTKILESLLKVPLFLGILPVEDAAVLGLLYAVPRSHHGVTGGIRVSDIGLRIGG